MPITEELMQEKARYKIIKTFHEIRSIQDVFMYTIRDADGGYLEHTRTLQEAKDYVKKMAQKEQQKKSFEDNQKTTREIIEDCVVEITTDDGITYHENKND